MLDMQLVKGNFAGVAEAVNGAAKRNQIVLVLVVDSGGGV
jgi:hypothetical protein